MLYEVITLIGDIKSGRADSWKRYFQNYDHYLGNQQKLFGDNWQTPTDIIAEARHYRLLTEHTLGDHTELLQQHQKPLEALQIVITSYSIHYTKLYDRRTWPRRSRA